MTISVTITEEERSLLMTLLNAARRTNLNNRWQSKDHDKDQIYLHKAAVIDILIEKVRRI